MKECNKTETDSDIENNLAFARGERSKEIGKIREGDARTTFQGGVRLAKMSL